MAFEPSLEGFERRTVISVDQVGQLVHDHGVDDPLGHTHHAIRQPNRGVGNGATSPPTLLIGHPPDRNWNGEVVASGQPGRPLEEIGRRLRLVLGEPGLHPVGKFVGFAL